MTNMNAAMYGSFGNPAEVISVTQTDMPVPGENEVLVKMIMSPIHNHDLFTIRGEYGVKPALPTIGGTEAVGTIAAVGANVSGIEIGTRIAVAGIQHSWAEYFTAPAASIVPVPAAMDNITAAQILGMPMGSVLALNQYGAKPGDWMIVNAGNGAVGKVIAAVGRARGLKVALLVRREQAKKDLTALGFDNVFVTSGRGWMDDVRNVIGNDCVSGGVDNIGGQATGEMASLISENGLLMSFGAMSGRPAEVDVSDLIFKQIVLRGYWSYKEFQKLTPDEIAALIAEIFMLTTSGQLPLPVDAVFPLARSAEAMKASAASRDGKILIAA